LPISGTTENSRISAAHQDEPGTRLKRVRDRLNLTLRDVEEASTILAARHNNDEFVMVLSRLSDIEKKHTLPSLYRLYSLCAIYRLDLFEVLGWYGIDMATQPADTQAIQLPYTNLINFGNNNMPGEVQVPLSLDPGIDTTKTTYLSRVIQRWGKLPLALLADAEVKNHRYAFIGSEDWSMYPLVQPNSLILIDDSQRKIIDTGWTNEFERPIYFFEHKDGYACSWCELGDKQVTLQPHPGSMRKSQVFKYPDEIEVIGKVTGVAMRLDQGPKRRAQT
jgi:transcriptional regulator with XRE-family HTH domain